MPQTRKPDAPSLSAQEPGEDIISISLREQYEQGDRLAPFLYAFSWKSGLCSGPVPQWVAEHFATLASDYFREAREALREGRRPPSLDKLAGLSGMKINAWKAANRQHTAHLLKHFFDRIIRDVRSSQREKTLQNPPQHPLLIRHNMFTDGECEPVPVLDKRGRPTRAFQIALGRWFNVVPSPDNVTEEAIYLAVRRLIRKASAAQTANIDK